MRPVFATHDTNWEKLKESFYCIRPVILIWRVRTLALRILPMLEKYLAVRYVEPWPWPQTIDSTLSRLGIVAAESMVWGHWGNSLDARASHAGPATSLLTWTDQSMGDGFAADCVWRTCGITWHDRHRNVKFSSFMSLRLSISLISWCF